MNVPLSKNLRGTREVNLSAYAWLFSEIVQQVAQKAKDLRDLEARLTLLGSHIGLRVLELLSYRISVTSLASLTAPWSCKRETRLLGILYFIHTTVWKSLFGKPADSLERSVEQKDEYMISDNDVLVNRFISIPKEYNQLNCGAFVAGIIEGILTHAQFVSL
jgi:hypothetical protein